LAGQNKYQYNGKELNQDFGLDWNDYGARFYDAATARWTAVDPLAESYKRWSPYDYTKDNPVKYIDPTGMSVETDYYNQKGKKIGTDGIDNGKVVVVTDNKEAKAIAETDKSKGTTAESDVKSGVELPDASVREQMGEAVDRSNSRNDKRTDDFKGNDNEGGFHEEGGRYGKGVDGKYHVVNAIPGSKTDPLTEGMATVDVGRGNAVPNSPLIETEGSFHVHPKGTKSDGATIGGKTGSFNQSPTPVVDYEVAANYPGKSYVLGAGSGVVTIHNGKGDLATFPLKLFISIGIKK
jgi:RHS repeat-associated protein